jgi:hypothetical protein
MRLRGSMCALAALALLVLPIRAQAQTPSHETWSVEGDVGWDFPVSGNILSAAIGQVFDQPRSSTRNHTATFTARA